MVDVERLCKWCNKTSTNLKGNRKYCSEDCRTATKKQTHKEWRDANLCEMTYTDIPQLPKIIEIISS